MGRAVILPMRSAAQTPALSPIWECAMRILGGTASPEGISERVQELINRQAYGFRNFQNYRLRVKVLCG